MSPKEEERITRNYVMCSSCDHVLECKERGKHEMCINYKKIGGDESGRSKVDKT